jgi:hypothetical protein
MLSLKRYMVYSFASLWTAVLIIALVATIIHQTRFQDSPTHIHLNWEVRSLELENQGLKNSLDQSEIKYDNYRQWVLSWR